MDVSLLIRHRLKELGLEQKDLAAAAEVTESYISQILARKKMPPSPGRTEIYEKIGRVLNLPGGELSRLAEVQRREELKRKAVEPPAPLFTECRELLLRKCEPARRDEVRRIFGKQSFGELERLVSQKLLDAAQTAAREELHSEKRLRLMSDLSGHSYERVRSSLIEFLDAHVFSVSSEACRFFLDAIVDSWDIDLKTFGLSVVLNRRLTVGSLKRYEFAEQEMQPTSMEPGLETFLKDASLSASITVEEIAFLRALRLHSKRPSPLYYYRELQNLRDPLHFPPAVEPREAD